MRSIQFQLNRDRIRAIEALCGRPLPPIAPLTEPQAAEVRAAFIQRFCLDDRHGDDHLVLQLGFRAQARRFDGPLVLDADRWSPVLSSHEVPGGESTVGIAYQNFYEIHAVSWADAARAHAMLLHAGHDTWIVSLSGRWAIIEGEEVSGFGVALSRF